MESLTETETETDDGNDHERAVLHHPPSAAKVSMKQCSSSSAAPSAAASVGCVPFFGVKHYLHNFYGLADDPKCPKAWQQIATEGQDDFNSTSSRRSERERCGRLRRLCFGYSIIIGLLISVLGITCLSLGYLLPRQPITVAQIEEEDDLKMWIATHRRQEASASLAILDRQAIEHNNVLDLLKIAGLMGICFGGVLLVAALVLPACRYRSQQHWADEPDFVLDDDEEQHISQLNQALKNCLRSIQMEKTHSTVFYSGVVATTDEKIPVFQQLQSVQPLR